MYKIKHLSTILSFFVLTIGCAMSASPTHASAAVYDWVRTAGSANTEITNSVTHDSSGNVYSTGTFRGTVDFDGTAGTDNHTADCDGSCSPLDHVFITKYESDGDYGWTRSFGNDSDTQANSIFTDSSGNVYVTGNFRGEIDFDGTAGSDSISAVGATYDSAYITKYESDGDYGWTRIFGNNNGETTANSIVVDSSGNVYVVGTFWSTVDFDGTAGTDNHSTTCAGGSCSPSNNAYITKYDTNGDYSLTRTFGDIDQIYVNAVATDSSGNVYIGGRFKGTIDFDGTAGTDSITSVNSGFYSAFFTKYESDGDYGFTKRFGNSTDRTVIEDIAVDSSDNLYVVGSFPGTVDFDHSGGTDNHSAGGGSLNSFFSKYDSAGDYTYTKIFSGSVQNLAYGIDVTDSYVYITGHYAGTVDFDASASTSNETSGGGPDIYYVSYTAAGVFDWVEVVDGFSASSSTEAGYGISEYSNKLAIGGMFIETVDFDPSAATDNKTSNGGSDSFLLQLDIDSAAPSLSITAGTDPTSDNTPSLSGTSTDALSTVSSVEFQMNATDGSWTACTADDGAFDESADAFTCTVTSELSDGSNIMYFRTTDSNSNVTDSSSYSSDTFTVDTASPSHTDVKVKSKTNTSFTVTWTTSEVSSSKIDYGATSSYGQSTVEADTTTRVTSHSHTVSDLTKCTTYHFRTKSTDSVSNTGTSGDNTVTTSGCSGGDSDASGGEPQIAEAGSGGVVSSVQESSGGTGSEQKVTAVIEEGTLDQDAYFSSAGQSAQDVVSTANLTTPLVDGESLVNLPQGSNAIIAGGSTGIIGVQTPAGIAWQVGPLQKLNYKTIPPPNSDKKPAVIIPGLQKKPTIITLTYTDLDLIPPGNPTTTFNPANFKIARSLDGITWTILDTTVVDITNKTVAALDKVYGYYMIVSPTSGFTGTFTTGTALGASTPTLNDEVSFGEVEDDHDDFDNSFIDESEAIQDIPDIVEEPNVKPETKPSFFQKVVGFVKGLFK